MAQFLFFFGRDPILSLAELTVCLNQENITIQSIWNNTALIEGTLSNPKKIIKKLGGTTKIAQVLFETPNLNSQTIFQKLEQNHFFEKLPSKFLFALSSVGKITRVQEEQVLRALKKGFKTNKQKAQQKKGTHHKQHNIRVTNPSEILSWKLLEDKTDWNLAQTPTGFLFCQTISVSNPKEWKQRDEKRPFKDNKEIISIRLAKILVNLVGLKEKQTLLDPFCGYATVLQEALLTGLNILGIEKDTHKSQVAQKNLEWIQKQFSTKGTIKIYNKDASQLASFLSPNSFHGVATEPYLGPYLKKRPTPYQAKTTIQELEPLYQTLFSKLAQLMKSNQKIVFIFPVFEWDRQKSITISPAVFAPWFYNTNPLQKKGPQFAKAFPAAYQNPKNKLKRTIWILTRK